jgi:hypothetical protein
MVKRLKYMFNLFILHDPIINKLLATTHEQIIKEMTPESEKQNTFHVGGPNAAAFKLDSLGQDLTGKEIKQYWIIEDFEALVGEIKRFRTESSSLLGGQWHKGQKGVKANLSVKWVDFYRQMINLGIMKLQPVEYIATQQPKLAEVVMAMTPEGSAKTEHQDNISENSESDSEVNPVDPENGDKDHHKDKSDQNLVIPEEDECSCDEDSDSPKPIHVCSENYRLCE